MRTLRFANVLMNSILFNMLTVATAVATVTKTDTVCQKVNDEHILHIVYINITETTSNHSDQTLRFA